MINSKDFSNPNEKIFRAAKPQFLFISSKNKVSDSLFDLRPKEKGVSFDRAMDRTDEESCKHMHSKLSGRIISLKVSQCEETKDILLEYTPHNNNNFHSELYYQTTSSNELDRIKHILAEKSVIEPF